MVGWLVVIYILVRSTFYVIHVLGGGGPVSRFYEKWQSQIFPSRNVAALTGRCTLKLNSYNFIV
jgi:hypothetical protein